MRKLVVTNNVTLDGVMQAPGRPDEDTRGGFTRGGWAAAHNDAEMAQAMGQGMGSTGAMVFGRRTYEDFYNVWHDRTDNPFSPFLDKVEKYVASTTLTEPLVWQNSTLLEGDAADAVERLKRQDGPGLAILGSGELIQSLRRRNLIDEYVLIIHPLVFGTGRRLFPEGGVAQDLKLVGSVTTSSGVIIANYQPA